MDGQTEVTPPAAVRSQPDVAAIALAALAFFAMLWAIARAAVQTVTGDEAETYELYVARLTPAHWQPTANNHILNSLLIRLSTTIFGLSPFTIRLPALVGAALYISIAYWLCRILTPESRLRIPLFVCLVYNPFVFDFFVAARGYGMATALLLAAIALPVWCMLGMRQGIERPLVKAMAAASALLALSFTANFSFAFADAIVLLAVMAWTFRVPNVSRSRLRASALLPGLAVTLLLPSWTLLHWPKGELFDGARSLTETLTTVIQASIYRPNSYLVNPLLFGFVAKIGHYLFPAATAAALLQAFFIWRSGAAREDKRAQWLAALATVLGVAIALTLLSHWLAFRLFGLLLPRNRTALYLVPLFTLLLGVIAAFGAPSGAARIGRAALRAVLVAMGLYFLCCMRLTYFREWQYQVDIRKTYDVVACYNHARGVRDVEVSWYYHAGMNFYRILSGRESLTPFTMNLHHPSGKKLYVLNRAFEGDFIRSEGLSVVYRGPETDIVVAVSPDLAGAAANECYIPPQP